MDEDKFGNLQDSSISTAMSGQETGHMGQVEESEAAPYDPGSCEE